MNGNFIYENPTKLIFGDKALDKLSNELNKYGDNILLVYGGGSLKKTGLYDRIIKILKESNKNVIEDSGVMSNPTIDKLIDGVNIVRNNNIDFILAVGGGSVIDYTKALAASVNLKDDIWQYYFINHKEPNCKVLPHGNVLTMVGTGSEMNGGSVITNPHTKEKYGHGFGVEVLPKFAILDPTLTFTVPHYQMVAGIFDTLSHIMEQYFSDNDDCANDYIMEGLMRSLIHSSKIAIVDPLNYEARSNIMWISTWALNNMICCGKTEDWMVHSIGQAIGGVTNATHGMTLSAISIPYYKYVTRFEQNKFARFAHNVFDIKYDKDSLKTALRGLDALEEYMREIGVVTNLRDLGVNESMIDDILNGTLLHKNVGYHDYTREEVRDILLKSL